jgi:methyltransferase (TIGR00027 family)
MVDVSDTAYSIATIRADEASFPIAERLFADPYAAIFARAGTHAAEATQRFLELPFFREMVRLRTRYLDDAVRAAIDAGLRQVVILGTGFDSRGLRIEALRAAGITVFEVDFAEQLARKRALLDEAGVSWPPHMVPVACDFNEAEFDRALERDLASHGFRVGAGALFVWEGVIGYIGDDVIDRSLRFMARAGGKGTRVAFTFGSFTFDPDGVEARTQRLGYTACADTGCDELWRRFMQGEPPPAAPLSRLGLAIV